MATFVFDLDGTIVDSARGIFTSLRHTLASFGAAAPDDATLRRYIGPPVRVVFEQLLGSDANPDDGVRAYREHYAREGITLCEPYPGIGEQLARLKEGGHTLFVCTSKLETFALTIIEHIGFTSLFEAIYGERIAGEHKPELLARLIREHGIDPASALMIGDRREDIFAGQKNGLATLGVLWGFGDLDELTAAGANAICERVDTLSATLLRR
jgi:phosphoglycolate phosphatase